MLVMLTTEGLESGIAQRSVAMLQSAIDSVEAIEGVDQTLAEVRFHTTFPTAHHLKLDSQSIQTPNISHQKLQPKHPKLPTPKSQLPTPNSQHPTPNT